MAMECAINVCIYALTQNLTLQGMDVIKFDLESKTIDHDSFISDVEIETETNTHPIEQQKQVKSSFEGIKQSRV